MPLPLSSRALSLHGRNSVRASSILSPFLRLVGGLRIFSRRMAPRGFGVDHLVPCQQLVAVEGAEPGTWRSVGKNPQFLLRAWFPAGWVRIRLRLTSAEEGQVKLLIDTGKGFSPEGFIKTMTVGKEPSGDFFVKFPTPVQALRLDPPDDPGQFRLEAFQVQRVRSPMVLGHAVWGKLRVLWQYGLLRQALGNCLGLVLRGRFAAIREKLADGLQASRYLDPEPYAVRYAYEAWRQHYRLTDANRRDMRAEAAAMPDPPLISVILPVYNTPVSYLRLAIDSVLRQTYPHWELCIADDGSTVAHVRGVLEEYAGLDHRIKVTFRQRRGHIAAASNTALALAVGHYIALLDHDDELAEHALFRVAKAIVADRDLDMLYSDEDKVELDGRHAEPFFKPDWSPELFLAFMYTCHLGVYRRSLVQEVGGFRGEFDTAQDYDLALRIVARTRRIKHIPDILYHWRKAPTSTATGPKAKPKAHQVARRALQSYLASTGKTGTVEPGPAIGLFRVRLAIAGNPKVSIIIPSACRPIENHPEQGTYVLQCVQSIRRQSTWKNYEIIVVHNNDVPRAVVMELDRLGVRSVAFTAPFNLSAKINLGAARATGAHLALMNDDMEIITPDWIEALLEFSQDPEIGAVGAKLLYPNGLLQHTGVVLCRGDAAHCFHQFPGNHPGYFCSNIVHRNCSAVTGACVMTRTEVFRSVGGFDELLPVSYNDIDFCLKIRTNGQRIVYMPYAQLYHYESASLKGERDREREAFVRRWRPRWEEDPLYSPHLSKKCIDYRIEVEHLLHPEPGLAASGRSCP